MAVISGISHNECEQSVDWIAAAQGAAPWIRTLVAGLSLQSHVFSPRLVYVGFVVDIAAVGEDFFRVLRCSSW